MNKQKLLVFDTQWMAFRYFYSMPPLSHADSDTHIIFSFIGEVVKHCHKFETNRICFPFDHKHSLRKDVYPEYKEKRNKNKQKRTPEEVELFKSLYQQVNLLREEILPGLGFNNIWQQYGLESDDIIANFVMRYGSEYDIIVFTKDEDLYQLLDYCSIYSPVKTSSGNSWKLYTKKDFVKEYGISPVEWIEVKKIAGCSSDNVAGIERVGIPTFLSYYLGNMNPNTKTYQKIETEKEKFSQINEKLVKLPHEATKDVFYVEDKFNSKSFVGVCAKYGFDSYLRGSQLDKWKEIFCEE